MLLKSGNNLCAFVFVPINLLYEWCLHQIPSSTCPVHMNLFNPLLLGSTWLTRGLFHQRYLNILKYTNNGPDMIILCQYGFKLLSCCSDWWENTFIVLKFKLNDKYWTLYLKFKCELMMFYTFGNLRPYCGLLKTVD